MALTEASSSELEHWIARSAIRDRKAFASLYAATSPRVFGFLINMVRDRQVAEEILQEAYLQVWEKAGVYSPERGQPLTWIVNVARYRALDFLRRQSTRTRYEEQYALDADTVATLDGETPAEGSALNVCLDRLQGPARESVVKAYCEGYTHEELSTVMGRPIGTVKSWIRRSIKRLKECLHELSAS